MSNYKKLIAEIKKKKLREGSSDFIKEQLCELVIQVSSDIKKAVQKDILKELEFKKIIINESIVDGKIVAQEVYVLFSDIKEVINKLK